MCPVCVFSCLYTRMFQWYTLKTHSAHHVKCTVSDFGDICLPVNTNAHVLYIYIYMFSYNMLVIDTFVLYSLFRYGLECG